MSSLDLTTQVASLSSLLLNHTTEVVSQVIVMQDKVIKWSSFHHLMSSIIYPHINQFGPQLFNIVISQIIQSLTSGTTDWALPRQLSRLTRKPKLGQQQQQQHKLLRLSLTLIFKFEWIKYIPTFCTSILC